MTANILLYSHAFPVDSQLRLSLPTRPQSLPVKSATPTTECLDPETPEEEIQKWKEKFTTPGHNRPMTGTVPPPEAQRCRAGSDQVDHESSALETGSLSSATGSEYLNIHQSVETLGELNKMFDYARDKWIKTKGKIKVCIIISADN